WTWPGAQPALWSAFVLAVIVVPAMLAPLAGLVPRTSGISKRSHARAVARDFRSACTHVAFTATVMAHQAALITDAITRTVTRLYVTRGRLLEWQSTAFSATRVPRTLRGF